MKLIAFTGKMGVGKSTAIQAIKDLQHHPIVIRKFAEPLYEIQAMIYDKIKDVYPQPKDFTKDRFLLQFLGTEWGRQKISDTLWIDLWKSELEKYSRATNNLEVEPIFVCDDLRYDNEAEAVKSLGGHVIQIVSTSADKRINTKDGIKNHISENGVDLKFIDFIIENNGSIEDLEGSLCALNDRVHIW